MSDVFISYARSTQDDAVRAEDALRGLGFSVWRDDALPAHRAYSEVIEERLRAAKAVLVLWSAEAARSHWVRAEAEVARTTGKLVQASLDGTEPPLPFNQIQCADVRDWSQGAPSAGWRKATDSLRELMGLPSAPAPAPAPKAKPVAPRRSKRPSIAVMPFADMSAAKDQDYFCDGMVMEIVTALSRFSSLTVISSDSSLAFRNTRESHAEIARQLGVRYLLEGGVRKAGDKVRITVQLIDPASGAQVWNDRFDGDLEDVFVLQDEVANAVAGRLVPRLERAEMLRRANERPTDDPDAYDLFLQAQQCRRTKAGLAESIALLDQALERDPGYAPALALAGSQRATYATWGYSDDPAETLRAAIELARRATVANQSDPQVLSLAGATIAVAGDDMATGEALIERALRLNPGLVEAWHASARVKNFSGRQEEALEHIRVAMRLDPKSGTRTPHLGWTLLFLRRFDEAIATMKEFIELNPDYEGPAVGLTAALAHAGRIEEAKAVLATIRPDLIAGMFGFFREAKAQEIIRSGLKLAGAVV